MRVGIFGTFDVENYGDLLFPIVAERELQKRLSNVELIPYSYYEKNKASWYYDVSCLTDLQKNAVPLQLLDGILIGGGHLIRFDRNVAYDYYPPIPQIPHPTGYWLAPALAGVFGGQPVAWNAPSASDGLPAWSHEMLRFALEKSAYVSVRDQASLESLHKTGYRGTAKVIPDTVFSLASHFPAPALKERTEELLSSIGVMRKYIIIQATSSLESIAQVLLSSDVPSNFDFVVLPIGPILGDDNVHIMKVLPNAKCFSKWPSPLEIAGLVAHSSGVVALSLHLSITALVYGLPVLRPRDTTLSKYEMLRSSENVFFHDPGDPNVLGAYKKALRSGERYSASLVQEAQSQHEEHWDAIAKVFQDQGNKLNSRANNYAKANFLLRRRENSVDVENKEDLPQPFLFAPLTPDAHLSGKDPFSGYRDTCVILHLYYPEMWSEILPYLSNLGSDFDLFITVPENVNLLECEIDKSFPNAKIYRCKNRGRDILPFLKVYSLAVTLDYKYICKVHTKKSPRYDDGDKWNWDLWDKLLGSRETVAQVKSGMDRNPRWAMVAPSGHLLPLMLESNYWGGNRETVKELGTICGFSTLPDVFLFPAGSMFWFQPGLFQRLLELGLSDIDFEPEAGQLDGTLAHGIERFFGLLAAQESCEIAESDSRGVKPAEISFHMVKLLKDFDDLLQEVSGLSKQVSNRDELLNEVYRSKAWQLVQFLRQIRLILIPTGSTREHIVRRAFHAVRSWRTRT